MENNTPKIYAAICAVMEDVGAVTKSKRNTQGAGFMYRGIDDVMNALNPAMAKHKIFTVPEVLEQTREERLSKAGGNLTYSFCKIKYTFYAEDGSNVEAVVIGEAMDSGDKATNKSMSIAFKYACFQVFCIPTEEMIDPDAETHSPSPVAKQTKPTNKPKQTAPAQTSKTPTQTTPPPIPSPERMDEVAQQVISDAKIKTIRGELDRTGVQEVAICKRYGFSKIDECTEELFIKVMSALNKTKSKEAAVNE